MNKDEVDLGFMIAMVGVVTLFAFGMILPIKQQPAGTYVGPNNVEIQQAMNKISPEKGLTFKISQKYSSAYIEKLEEAMNLINSGKQTQAIISGPLDNDVFAFLAMKGFVATDVHTNTSGFLLVTSSTRYVIEKKTKDAV